MNNVFQMFLSLLGIFGRWVNWAIVFVLIWPLLMVATSIVGSPALTAIVALSPLLVLVAVLISLNTLTTPGRGTTPRQARASNKNKRTGRRIIGAAAAVSILPIGRKILGTVAVIAGIEFAIGAYFSGVPVANDKGLIPLAFLLILAMVFLYASGFKKLGRVALMSFLVVTVVFFLGGREGMGKKVSALTKPTATFSICGATMAGVNVTLAKPEGEMKLSQKCNSGPVRTPTGGPRYKARIFNDGGELFIVFPDGRELHFDANEEVELKGLQNVAYRLRGDGVAKIVIEPLDASSIKVVAH